MKLWICGNAFSRVATKYTHLYITNGLTTGFVALCFCRERKKMVHVLLWRRLNSNWMHIFPTWALFNCVLFGAHNRGTVYRTVRQRHINTTVHVYTHAWQLRAHVPIQAHSGRLRENEGRKWKQNADNKNHSLSTEHGSVLLFSIILLTSSCSLSIHSTNSTLLHSLLRWTFCLSV